MFTWIKSMSRVTNRLLQSIYNPPLCTSVCKPFTTIIWPISSNIVRVNDFSLLFLLFKYIFAQFSRYIKVLGFAALHGNHNIGPGPARPGGSTQDPGDLGPWLCSFYWKPRLVIGPEKTGQPVGSTENSGDLVQPGRYLFFFQMCFFS
jgi:hypothetical protein